MVTEQELQEALADAVDDPAADVWTLGLSDRALAQARVGSRWWRPMEGKRAGARVRWVPTVAIGSAFVVAGAIGIAALGGGAGSGSAGSGSGGSSATAPPKTATKPVGQSAVTSYAAECFNGHGPKLDLMYVWDPAAQQYQGITGDAATDFHPSPDGKQALLERDESAGGRSWAVGSWADAVAGRVTPHVAADQSGVHWTADGKEIVNSVAWDVAKDAGGSVLKTRTADFYDPASGHRLASVPLPQEVLSRVASGQWSLQEFQGDHDAVLFPLLRADGDRLDYLNAQGATVRTLTLQGGLPANDTNLSASTESAVLSPDGRYLMESEGTIAVFDLQAGGKRIGSMDVTAHPFTGWIGAHQIATVIDEHQGSSLPKGTPIPSTGHSPVYTVLTPDLKVVQQTTFVLPTDPQGLCTTWPESWAPAGQFPGAFVP